MTFGEKLVKARIEKGLTVAKLAEKAGCSTRAIKFWEQDKAEISFFNAVVLSQVLGLSLNYLAGLED